jgi:hypothetical protein
MSSPLLYPLTSGEFAPCRQTGIPGLDLVVCGPDPVAVRAGSPATYFTIDPLSGQEFPCYGPGERSPRGVTFDNVNRCPEVPTMSFFPEPTGLELLAQQAWARCGPVSPATQACHDAFTLGLQQLAGASGMMSTASPTGGPMSSSWFGLGGFSPGGTTPILPFGLPFQAGGGGTNPFGLPTLGDAAGGGGGSIFGTVVQAIPGLLTGLANAGIIRGSVGQIFATMPQQQAPQFPVAPQLPPGSTIVVGANGQLQVGNMGMSGGFQLGEMAPMPAPMPIQGPIWTQPQLGGGACGPRGSITLDPSTAPGLYRQGCSPCSPVQTRARFFALRPDGTRDLFVRVGKVQSVSQRTLTRFARRWSREAGLTTTKRGARARGRSRRRPR